MKQCAIFLDMDGTFLASGGKLIQENVDTVTELISKGHKVFICSGRPRASIHDYIKDALPWSGIISSMGAEIIIEGKEVRREEIPQGIIRELAKIFINSDTWAVFGNGEDGICVNIEPRLKWIKAESMEDFDRVYKYTTKLDFGPPPEELKDKVEEIIGDKLNIYYYDTYTEGAQNSKSDGMRFVLEKLNIPVENSIAVGDSQNDLDVLKSAGIGIAMGNSSKKVKEEADMVADTNDNAGVAKILREVIK